MPLNAAVLSDLIKAQLLAGGVATETDPVTGDPSTLLQETCDAIAESIVDHVVANQLVTIPAGAVIVSVTGGSGSPAVGVPNISPIPCDVS